ncbi:dTDP-4-dehydrorhamnose reductase [Entomomonas asaccharolytica]|uniref:dTDP-4-dehydrorhamnose reductase n=1 Tax=Entomomonas asaccharolytica TaxID=2785331 RepID=A0A974NCU4_9GAMM|nr:dTDP-4-dehydrorhamnose reductase [Entomomonas asaccharolytica]QQP84401.1 dTDP-4-dehydrorhamnose reductase [Entomomonas asaccharolytica]
MANKILLLGKNGQVGWELQRSLAPVGQLLALDRHDQGGDLTDLKSLQRIIVDYQPTIIVNATAYTAVDKAETETELALQINGKAVEFLAEQAKQYHSWLIHYSTDYVFDGSGDTARLETAETNPLNIYGKTKLVGEQAIQQLLDNYLIFRTSWVYATHGNNFIKTMLRLAKEREELAIINDQIGSPTGAELIADITAHAIKQLKPELAGIYHLTAGGETSWYDFANVIFAEAKLYIADQLKVKKVNAITTDSYPTPAKRPLNSRLATSKLINTFDITLPDWQLGVKRVIAELLTE